MKIIKSNKKIGPKLPFLVAISLTSAILLSLEITLTRIFSVIFWYHYAFLAISICLGGASLAGLVLFFWPGLTRTEKFSLQLSRWSFLLALALVLGLLVINFLSGPFFVYWLSLYFVMPFFFGSLILGLSFTKFSQHINHLYFADLLGAGLGCFLALVLINFLGAPNSLLVLSLLSIVVSLIFLENNLNKFKSYAIRLFFCLVILFLIIKSFPAQIISLKSTKNSTFESQLLYEKWNTFSQITVWKNPNLQSFYWSLSPAVPLPTEPDFLPLLIDANALTPIHHFSGNLSQFDWLKSDLPAFAYRLLPPAPQVYVIGAGGGHDVLTGLVAGASRIDGAEINSVIVGLIKNKLSEFAGNLYDLPNVNIVAADARNNLAHSDQKYDLIIASLIDTWAASSANAFALTENQLYTLEAFQLYLDHLSDHGILSFVRWYSPDQPAETLRLASLSLSALKQSGVADPPKNIVVVANSSRTQSDQGLAVVLVQKHPYTSAQIDQILQLEKELQFQALYLPGQDHNNPVSRFIQNFDQKNNINSYPYDLTPPTDDRPFFFNYTNLTQVFSNFSLSKNQPEISPVIKNLIIFCLLAILIGFLIILMPWLISSQIKQYNRIFVRSRIIYFAAIGLGFMLTEISLLGRLTVYLGHPIYALLFVLAVLLISGGFGSRVSPYFATKNRFLPHIFILIFLVINLLSCNFLFPVTDHWSILSKILICFIQIFPLALFLGTLYPLAIKPTPSVLIPWFFSINTSFSVLGSILGTLVVLQWGFSSGLVMAAMSYFVIMLFYKPFSSYS